MNEKYIESLKRSRDVYKILAEHDSEYEETLKEIEEKIAESENNCAKTIN